MLCNRRKANVNKNDRKLLVEIYAKPHQMSNSVRYS